MKKRILGFLFIIYTCHCFGQINKDSIDKIARYDPPNIPYDRCILKADSAFKAKDYIEAKKNYQKALTIKPNEDYPKEQIKEVDYFMKEQ